MIIIENCNSLSDLRQKLIDDEEVRTARQEPCEDWYDVPSDEMTLEQARQAVKDLRKKLAECLDQEPCEDAVSRQAVLDLIEDYDLSRGQVVKGIHALPPVNPQPCEDAISRQAVIDSLHSKFADGFDSDRWWNSMSVLYVINKVPPVNPTKRGHWLEHPEIETSTPEYLMFYECSECGDRQCFCKSDINKKRFCGNCGCRMVEPQERSDKR